MAAVQPTGLDFGQAALTDLVSGKYDSRAKQLSSEICREKGIDEAIRDIEEYVG